MNNGYEKRFGGGRGRRLTTAGAARDCARAIIFNHRAGGPHMKYNMEYFGRSMRAHMDDILDNGMEVDPELERLVVKAESLLKTV